MLFAGNFFNTVTSIFITFNNDTITVRIHSNPFLRLLYVVYCKCKLYMCMLWKQAKLVHCFIKFHKPFESCRFIGDSLHRKLLICRFWRHV